MPYILYAKYSHKNSSNILYAEMYNKFKEKGNNMNRADMLYDLSAVWAITKDVFPYFYRIDLIWVKVSRCFAYVFSRQVSLIILVRNEIHNRD